jgi:ribosomal-protein-alanine acetyltransferase
VADIAALVELEDVSFDTDRLTSRNFQYLLTKGNAACVVANDGERLIGYAMVLFNAGTSLARLYSFAVDPGARQRGVGGALMAAAEDAARDRECTCMRLEVRPDNAAAIALYRSIGYRDFGILPDFYEDHADALRLEKALVAGDKPELARVPYYAQTLDFTCGPSALMMAMTALDPKLRLNRNLEVKLWRESTTVFMTSGHGGCSPYGLGLAAERRGFKVEMYVSDRGDMFVDSVRSAEKKAVMRLVEADFRHEVGASGITVHYYPLGLPALTAAVDQGGIPIVLISSYRLYRERCPHYLVVTGYDERFIYAHDPLLDSKSDKTRTDCINVPIPRRNFERMSRYGRAQVRACLILRKSNQPTVP